MYAERRLNIHYQTYLCKKSKILHDLERITDISAFWSFLINFFLALICRILVLFYSKHVLQK